MNTTINHPSLARRFLGADRLGSGWEKQTVLGAAAAAEEADDAQS